VKTLSCCVIAKNTDPLLEKAIASIRPFVDEVVLLWTCKPDAERPKVEGVDVAAYFDGCNAQVDCSPDSACRCKAGDLINFSAARNESFRLASGDLCTYVDSDDIVVGAGDLRALYKEEVRVVSPYEYAYSDKGQCIDRIYTDRVVLRTMTWSQPVHNVFDFPPTSLIEKSDQFVWKHQRTLEGMKRSRSRSLRILRHWEFYPKYQSDPRFIYYLGRVHLDCGMRERAARELERALALETFTDQRAIIALDLVQSVPLPRAVHWAHVALEIRPEWPKPWLVLARLYHLLSRQGVTPKKNARLSKQFLDVGLACENPNTVVAVDPTDKDRIRELILGS
jgi:hypothetical protein